MTLGSPIGLFFMRNKKLWSSLNQGHHSNSTGILCPFERRSVQQWLNFFDSDDLVAYPLEPIFRNSVNKEVSVMPTDIEVSTGWVTPWAHINYWHNGKVAEKIARLLAAQN